MTEQDDELKNLFQQKNREDAFTPDEQNWEKMAAMIKNERSSKRRFFVYCTLLLLVGIGSGWLFIEHDKNETTLALKPQASSSKTEEPTSKQIFISEQIESRDTNNSVREKNKTKREINQVEEAYAAPSINTQETAYKKPVAKSNTPEQETINNTIIKKPIPKEITSKETTALLVTPNALEEESTGKPTDDGISQKPIKKKPSIINDGADKTADKENKGGEEKPTAANLSKTELNKSQDKNTNKQSPLQIDTVSSAFLEIQKPEPLLTEALAMKKILVPAERPDFTIAAIVTMRDSVLPKNLLSHRIFLEAGINYNLGWKTNKQTEATGFNPLVGLQYYRDISKRAGFSVGLMYTTINHLSATSHTSTTTYLKFGEEVDATVVSAQNMHYLLIPLKLNYSLSRNDFVCIGYTMAYLLNVDSKIETYSTRLNYTSTPVVSKSKGYSKGFSPYDGQIAIGYRRRLYKECYLNGEFFYGLQDIKNDLVYKSEGFERAYGFRLSVGINLWKK